MKANTVELETKICLTCGRLKPLNAEHWRRKKNSPDGFDQHCKPCAQQAIKAHYRSFAKADVVERGEVGVKCILWAPRCGVCPCVSESDLSACWRIAKIGPDSERYPVELT